MKPGRASQTAVLVCAARAAAHGRISTERFSDPTAMLLLPDEARAQVERLRAGRVAQERRARMSDVFLERRAAMMVARTIAIDDAIRERRAPQLVILGAGLDGRAWRMPELRGAIVFEVDHPDSQADKRARIGGLEQAAREVRFVPVDFERDDLGSALQAAGHDPSLPTTWIWEGVVMYLRRAEIESTLGVVDRRSSAGSRLVVLYHRPSLILPIVGLLVRRLGEPFRTALRPAQMRALLERHGFDVTSDEDAPAIGRSISPEVAAQTRSLRHMRVVVADRRQGRVPEPRAGGAG